MAWRTSSILIRSSVSRRVWHSRWMVRLQSPAKLYAVQLPAYRFNAHRIGLFHSSTGREFISSSPRFNGANGAFKYPPLNSQGTTSKDAKIRLLTLLPGGPNDPIQCNLSVVPLFTDTKYEAISYSWGDPNDTEIITCNFSPLSIPWNLAAAL